MFRIICITILLLFSANSVSANDTNYLPNTGDQQLDKALVELNTKVNNKKRSFIFNLSNEYQVPPSKIENLMMVHEFTPADCFLTVAIADGSGQSVDVISRARIEHKDKGWKYITHQLRIGLQSDKFLQIKKDVYLDFTR